MSQAFHARSLPEFPHQRNYMVGRTRDLFVVYHHEPNATSTRNHDTHFVLGSSTAIETLDAESGLCA